MHKNFILSYNWTGLIYISLTLNNTEIIRVEIIQGKTLHVYAVIKFWLDFLNLFL